MSDHNCPVCNRPYADHDERQSERCAEQFANR